MERTQAIKCKCFDPFARKLWIVQVSSAYSLLCAFLLVLSLLILERRLPRRRFRRGGCPAFVGSRSPTHTLGTALFESSADNIFCVPGVVVGDGAVGKASVLPSTAIQSEKSLGNAVTFETT